MKSIFRIVALLCLVSACAFGTVNVSGTIKDPSGTVVPNSFVRFELTNTNNGQCSVSGASIGKRTADFTANATTGAVSGTLYRNDTEVSCAGSFNTRYNMTIFRKGVPDGPSKCVDVTADFDISAPQYCTTPPPVANPAQYVTTANNNSFTGNNAFTGSNTHAGTETFNAAVTITSGTATLGDAILKSPRYDVRWRGADPTGVLSSGTAVASVVTDLGGNGGTIFFPRGNYTGVCNLTLSGPYVLEGDGKTAWSTATSNDTTRWDCATAAANAVHMVNGSGNTTILHGGSIVRRLHFRDRTNAGAGGLMNEAVLIDSANRWGIEDALFDGFTNPAKAVIRIDGSGGGDASYGYIRNAFIVGCGLSGILENEAQGSGTVIEGGEIGGCKLGIDLEGTTNTTNTTAILGTSIDGIPANGVGVKVATSQATIRARNEAAAAGTGATGTWLTSTAKNNIVQSGSNKTDIAIQADAGSLNNVLDASNVVNVKQPIYDLGDGNLHVQAGREFVLNTDISGTRTAAGFRAQRDSSGQNTMSMLLGAGGNFVVRNSDNFQPVSTICRDASGVNVTATLPLVQPFAVGNHVTFSGAVDSSFDINTVVVGSISASTPGSTVTWPQAGTPNACSTGGYLYLTGGGAISAPTNNALILFGGAHGKANNNGFADDPNVTSISLTNGNLIFTADTGKTVGSSFGTLTTRFSCSSSGCALGSGGSTISTILTASATLTYTSIAAQTCQEQPITVTNSLVANKGVKASPQAEIGANLMFGGARVSAAGTVQVRVCNVTTASITPAAVTWGVQVTQ